MPHSSKGLTWKQLNWSLARRERIRNTDSVIIPRLVHHIVNVVVYVVLFTELVCEGQAGEMLQPVPVYWVYIKPNDEGREQPDVGQQRDSNEDAFTVCVESPECDVGQESEGEQHAAEETKNVGDIVDPRQKATQEEEEDDAKQFVKGLPWLLQHLPALKQFNKQASKESKLRPCWTHLQGENRRDR